VTRRLGAGLSVAFVLLACAPASWAAGGDQIFGGLQDGVTTNAPVVGIILATSAAFVCAAALYYGATGAAGRVGRYIAGSIFVLIGIMGPDILELLKSLLHIGK
jgi:hypothetical protein